MLRYIALFLIGSAAYAAPPISTFQILQNEDGSQIWIYTLNDSSYDPALIRKSISGNLANAHWCPSGWLETSRAVVAKNLVIEGRCK